MTEVTRTTTRNAAAAAATDKRSRISPIFVLLLLTSIVAHGILYSSRFIIQPSLERDATERVSNTRQEKSEATTKTAPAPVTAPEKDDVENSRQQQQQQQQLVVREPKQLRERTQDVKEQEEKEKEEQLPHWRLTTDCSSYGLDCFTTARRENKYLPYPFSSQLRTETELKLRSTSNESNNAINAINANADADADEWSVETINQLPKDWIQRLRKTKNKRQKSKIAPIEERNYLYPPTVPEDEYRTCLDLAIHRNKTSLEQLDVLLFGEGDGKSEDNDNDNDNVSPVIVPEPDTNMVAFTISDYSYVKDMLHEVFQMMDETVGFSQKHFFLVALDRRSVKLACRHGYPVVLWKDDRGSLKNAVANTKIVLSHELVKRGIDFLFTEMDVWWIASPKPHLVDFQNRHINNDDNSNDNNDKQIPRIYFSPHQNNPTAPNIGVYAVKADKYSEEYFRVCLDILKEKPQTHDQWVLAEVYRLFEAVSQNRTYQLGGSFKPDGPPKAPWIENPFPAMFFSPHEVVADERPMPTQQTLAIHTLNNAPLQMPHGKKMVAKELGVFYGFHTNPATTSNTGNGNDNNDDDNNDNGNDDDNTSTAAGYYDRKGKNYRRYMWLDTETRSNFYSITQPNRYHDHQAMEWTMAILIAIARKTDRILVLPQIFDADMDAGSYFPWTIMDYSKVNDQVDFRETNFPSNMKAWKNGNSKRGGTSSITHWPFESVVNTGIFKAKDSSSSSVFIYTEVTNRSSTVSRKAWSATLHEFDRMDAWIGSLLTVPELESAEVLLVNPDVFMDGGEIGQMVSRLLTDKRYRAEQASKEAAGESADTNDDNDMEQNRPPPVGRMEREVQEIYDSLGWCWDFGMQHTVSKVSASDSCYGIGNPRNYR